MNKVELVIPPREKDLGELVVRRILPYATHRMVGPFIFFDHMGPADFPAHQGVNVRPHPHIGLATVTYLFEGKIRHRDSLGSDQLIEPGAINWMVAGKGIVHSERAPEEVKQGPSRLNGIQCWLALPEELEDIEPSFKHYPASEIPEFHIDGVKLRLLLGKAFDRISPVKVHSDLFYIEVDMPQGSALRFKADGRELAAYIVDGAITANDTEISHCRMAVLNAGEDLVMQALEKSKVMLLGGQSVGSRHIFWNFVSSSKEKLETAKQDWRQGPHTESRFLPIPDDDQEFIPLPQEPGNPKGTIM